MRQGENVDARLGTLASLFTPSSPKNPLSWNTEHVMQWLQREDLGVPSEAVEQELITGIALMQINDENIKRLLNVKLTSALGSSNVATLSQP